MTLRAGWFATGRGEGSRRLLAAAVDAVRRGDLDAEIAFVFCNRERGEYEATDGFLDLVESYGIPLLTLSSRRFRRERGGALSKPGEPLPPWREEYDRAVADLLAQHDFDIGMLAGYMLIFTPVITGRYHLLNLHPALPGGPAGTWQDVIWQLIDARADRSGVMVHRSTEQLDEGPVVTYCSYSLRGPELDALWTELGRRTSVDIRSANGEEHALFREVRRQGAARERPLVVETLRAFAEGRLRFEDGRLLDAAGRAVEGGLDLSAEVDAAAARELGARAASN
jgi:phosphoribosylglycinamide formyltransferase-1